MIALLLMSQVPFIGLEEDRKAFDPYRQCVLREAKKQYASQASLKLIFERSQQSCVKEHAGATAQIILNSAERGLDATAAENGVPGEPDNRLQLFENELLFEVANDFVPRTR